MRRSRFFVDASNVDLTNKTISIDDINQIRQILTVLRLRIGDELDVLDGVGSIYPCTISSSTAVKGKIRTGDRLVCTFDSSSAAGGESSVSANDRAASFARHKIRMGIGKTYRTWRC